ncbi:MAG: glycosyltransferase family 2 protein [Sedimentisphaerales bacterium]|nr:glycosyltransferase family 2 protein [Sedimentisphaerales bacterium]
MIISAIIPAFNAAPYLERAIHSVLVQTRPADEIIIVDDGSTDNTHEIAAQFGKKIKLIRQANAGVSAARNTGIRAAKGDWIAFLDADDEWLPDRLRLQCELLEQHKDLSWVTGNFLYCYCSQGHAAYPALGNEKRSKVIELLGSTQTFNSFFQAYALQASGHIDAVLVRKDKLLEAGLFAEGQKIIEDEDMWLKLGYMGLQLGFIPEPIAVYHIQVPDSAMQTIPDSNDVETVIVRHLDLAKKAGYPQGYDYCLRTILGYWLYRLLMANETRSARRLLRKFGFLLGFYCTATSYIGSFCPALWQWNEKRKQSSRES